MNNSPSEDCMNENNHKLISLNKESELWYLLKKSQFNENIQNTLKKCEMRYDGRSHSLYYCKKRE